MENNKIELDKTVVDKMVALIDDYIVQLDKQRAEYTERLKLIRMVEAHQLKHKHITLGSNKGE